LSINLPLNKKKLGGNLQSRIAAAVKLVKTVFKGNGLSETKSVEED